MELETAELIAEQVVKLVTPATIGKWVAIEATGEFSPTVHDAPYNADGAAWLVLLDDISSDTIMALFNPGHTPGNVKETKSETAKPAKPDKK